MWTCPVVYMWSEEWRSIDDEQSSVFWSILVNLHNKLNSYQLYEFAAGSSSGTRELVWLIKYVYIFKFFELRCALSIRKAWGVCIRTQGELLLTHQCNVLQFNYCNSTSIVEIMTIWVYLRKQASIVGFSIWVTSVKIEFSV